MRGGLVAAIGFLIGKLTAGPPSPDGPRVGPGQGPCPSSVDDPYAVAVFLSLLDRLGLRDHAGQIADRVVAHFADRRHPADDMMKQDGCFRCWRP